MNPLQINRQQAMKKTYRLNHPKIKRPRQIEAVKNDVRKYIKRERKKELPEGSDFWDFDCKFGPTPEQAQRIHSAEITKYIDAAETQKLESFYLEIQAKPSKRTKKPTPESEDD